MLRVPYRILAPAVIVLCTIGTYSVNGSIVETWIMFVAGIVGFFMKLFGFSPAAVVLALVLGPACRGGACARRSRSRAAPLRSSSSARCRSGSSAITLAILLAAPLLRRFQSRAA